MMKRMNEDDSFSEHYVRTTHAEQNIIVQAATNGIAIKGGSIYCTMEPCMVCAKMIINAGIIRVVCKKRYQRGQLTKDLFRNAGVELVTKDDSVMEYTEK